MARGGKEEEGEHRFSVSIFNIGICAISGDSGDHCNCCCSDTPFSAGRTAILKCYVILSKFEAFNGGGGETRIMEKNNFIFVVPDGLRVESEDLEMI